MEALDKIILTVHIVFGAISLILFWIPIIVKKGGKTHNRVGIAYVYCMWIVIVTSFLLSIINFLQGYVESAAFLGFLGFLTSIPLWYAINVLKHKKNIPLQTLKIKKTLYQGIFFIGLGLFIWGIYLKLQGMAILMLIFGGIGMSTWKEAFKSVSFYKDAHHWIHDHIQGMITSGIAAYTAFFAFGGGNFLAAYLKGPLMAVPWVQPSIIGTIVIIKMKKKYQLR